MCFINCAARGVVSCEPGLSSHHNVSSVSNNLLISTSLCCRSRKDTRKERGKSLYIFSLCELFFSLFGRFQETCFVYCLCAIENQSLLFYSSSNLNLEFRTREMTGHCRMLLVKLYCSCCAWIWTKQKELITLDNDTEAWNMNSVHYELRRNCWLQN